MLIGKRLFGLETEYGIQIDGVGGDTDVVVESMELIRAYLREDFVARWDYDLENPRMDIRGFEVDELLNDIDETVHLQRDRKRKIPRAELKSDLILTNGARLYNDHTHPEYSTPECYSLRDLIASDRAGELILLQCGRRRTDNLDSGVVRLYKNNTDFEGHSYGCHENYLISRALPFEHVIDGLLPFLATRQVFAGAGKVGVEGDRGAEPAVFQLAQRSDFFETIASVDTMTKRPLVNTRDEPHAEAAQFRRLHIIIGDSNMSDYVTALKVGSMLLVLYLIESGQGPDIELADPLGALKSISRDPSRRWPLELVNGRHSDALEVQRAYLEHARVMATGRDEQTDWVLGEWATMLECLGRDPDELVGRCDWVTKKWLLDAFAEAEGLDWDNPEHRIWLQSQDLEYHNVDPESGLYQILAAYNDDWRLTNEMQARMATQKAPPGTRAYFRGRSIEKFGDSVQALNWDSIEFDLDGRTAVVDLKGLVDGEVAAKFNRVLDTSATVQDLVAALESNH